MLCHVSHTVSLGYLWSNLTVTSLTGFDPTRHLCHADINCSLHLVV